MRLTATEKREVIRLVEESDLSVRRTLRELQVPRATFYTWYRRYTEAGVEALTPRPSAASRYWNRIPPRVRQRVVDLALAVHERTPRGWGPSADRAPDAPLGLFSGGNDGGGAFGAACQG